MKKTKQTLVALATVLSGLSLIAGNHPNRIKLGEEPVFTKKATSGIIGKSDRDLNLTKLSDDEEQAKGVAKINIMPLFFKSISLQYEYGFHKNMSGALGVNFLLKRNFPGFFTEEDPTGEGLRNTTFGGWSVTPEFRFYPGKKEEHQAPHGFYVGAYVRYAKYKLNSNYTENFSNGKTYSYDMELTYKGSTVGILIGSQWLLGKHFSLDWWILGGGIGKAKLTMEASGSGFIMNDAEQAEVKASVEDEFSKVKLLGFDTKVTTTTNSVKAVVSNLPMRSIRSFGLCLGFAF